MLETLKTMVVEETYLKTVVVDVKDYGCCCPGSLLMFVDVRDF